MVLFVNCDVSFFLFLFFQIYMFKIYSVKFC